MAENNEYVFRFINDTQPEPQAVAGEAGKTTPKQQAVTPTQSAGGDNRKAIASGIVALHSAASYAKPLIAGRLQRVQVETGLNEYSQRVNEAVGFASGMAGEAVKLTVVGLASGGAGALVVALKDALSTVTNVVQKQLMLDTQKSVENTALTISRRRAGVSGSRR